MTEESNDDRRRRTGKEASLWLERLERILKYEEGESFRKWLNDPLHREVILNRCKLWHGPEILAVLLELIPDAAPASRRSRGRRLALAALFVISVLVVSALLLTLTPASKAQLSSLRAQQVYRTPVGVKRTVGLPDGSTMILNTATHVLVSYGPNSRNVELLEGEASLSVNDDPNRPFILSAGIRQFAVHPASGLNLRRVDMETLELTVMKGQVDALRNRLGAPSTLTPAQLRNRPIYGEHTFSSSEGGSLEAGCSFADKFAATQMRQRLAWQQDLIVLTNETLESALKEVERYTSKRFVIADEALRKVRLSAELPTGDVGAFLRVLRDKLQIDSASNNVGDIVLSRSEA